jgi:hypothetical protein
VSFDTHPVQSLSFTGPSADVLTRVLFASDKPATFDLGLVPGVFLGAFVAAALFGELELEGFQGGASMRRYIIGALCMGLGGMLAGGCAVGAGLSGTAVFTITAYVTLTGMWVAAAITDRLLDQHPTGTLDQAAPVAVSTAPGQVVLPGSVVDLVDRHPMPSPASSHRTTSASVVGADR